MDVDGTETDTSSSFQTETDTPSSRRATSISTISESSESIESSTSISTESSELRRERRRKPRKYRCLPSDAGPASCNATAKANARAPASLPAYMQKYTLDELAFFRRLSDEQRSQIETEERRISEMDGGALSEPMRFRILRSKMTDRIKQLALFKLSNIEGSGASGCKVVEWINGLLNLPIGVYKSLPVSCADPGDAIGGFLKKMRDDLDVTVYGHDSAKDHVVRLIAQWISNPSSRGLVLGIHGPPGVGKTELCKAVCRCLGLPFAFMPLGGVNDGSYLDGHSYTYEGSTWGRIADVLMKCKCSNPVLFFDELDKISDTRHGEEVVNLLIHMTDSTQNTQFTDKYFADIDIDLSRCLMVFSFNDESLVSPVLLDRMTRVSARGYNTADKIAIARDYLLPAILGEFGFARDDVRVSKDIIRQLVSSEQLQNELGVRGLKRALYDIVSHINYNRLLKTAGDEGPDPAFRFPVDVTPEQVREFAFVDSQAAPMPLSVRAMYV